MGFSARWRIYETALQISPVILAVMVISSALALIAYVLALTRLWWGPPQEGESYSQEPLLLRTVLVMLTLMLLTIGLWPSVLTSLHLNLADRISASSVIGRLL